MRYRLGLKPPRPGAVKLRFADYLKPTAAAGKLYPSAFGHGDLVKALGMLGNDTCGDCFFAGAAHRTMLWTAAAGRQAAITAVDAVGDYSACTGFELGDPSTDQGTDMDEGAQYWRKTGVLDAADNRHQIGAYTEVEPGNIDEILTAAYMLESCELGLIVGDAQQEQFSAGQPWDGDTGSNPGGHFVPIADYQAGVVYVLTWGKRQAVTLDFIRKQNDQTIACLSTEMLTGGKSLEGFDLAALADDLKQVTMKGSTT